MKFAMLAQAGSPHTVRWCRGLAARGHEITLISNDRIKEAPPGITTRFLPGSSATAYFRNVPRVKKLVAAAAPDIVHAHYATGYGLWGLMQCSAPLVVSAWGTDIEDAIARPHTVGAVTRRALKKATTITASSKFLQSRIVTLEPSLAAKVIHIPFGVDIPVSPPAPKSNEAVVFIFAKSYLENYAPEMVVRAFARVRDRMPAARLSLIGGGPLQEKLQSLVGDLAVDDIVTVEGRLDVDAASARIAAADIMVMPSRTESFGVAALEAAACGRPVIATRVGGIPEIVNDGENGILIDRDDETALVEAMIRLAGDDALRRRMGEAGRKLAAERYDFEKCLDMMETVYHDAAVA